jgi:hypothetical protein
MAEYKEQKSIEVPLDNGVLIVQVSNHEDLWVRCEDYVIRGIHHKFSTLMRAFPLKEIPEEYRPHCKKIPEIVYMVKPHEYDSFDHEKQKKIVARSWGYRETFSIHRHGGILAKDVTHLSRQTASMACERAINEFVVMHSREWHDFLKDGLKIHYNNLIAKFEGERDEKRKEIDNIETAIRTAKEKLAKVGR